MSKDIGRLQVTMQQMDRLLRALEDLKQTVLPTDPHLFATMAEAPLDDLERLRSEISDLVHELKPSA